MFQNLERRFRRNPPNIALIIVIVNLAGYAFMLGIDEFLPRGPQVSQTEASGAGIIHAGALSPHHVLKGELFRLFTCMLLHGGIMHLLMNSFAMWNLGQITQQIMGAKRLVTLYIFGGLFSSVVSIVWKLLRYTDNPLDFATLADQALFLSPSVGASGAVFAVFGFLIGATWDAKDAGGRAFRGQLIFWLLLNLYFGFQSQAIDNAAHLGGLAFGIAIARYSGPRHFMKFFSTKSALKISLAVAVSSLVWIGAWSFTRPGQEFRAYAHLVPIIAGANNVTVLQYDQLDKLNRSERKDFETFQTAIDELDGQTEANEVMGELYALPTQWEKGRPISVEEWNALMERHNKALGDITQRLGWAYKTTAIGR